MAYKEYRRFGFGIEVFRNGEAKLAMTGKGIDGTFPVVASIELTEHQAVALLADLVKFCGAYIADFACASTWLNSKVH